MEKIVYKRIKNDEEAERDFHWAGELIPLNQQ